MGQAKQRGTREQRVTSATPKAKKLSADERRVQQAQALVGAAEVALRPILRALGR